MSSQFAHLSAAHVGFTVVVHMGPSGVSTHGPGPAHLTLAHVTPEGHSPFETTSPPRPHRSHWHLLPAVVRLPSAFSQHTGSNWRVQGQGDGSVILVAVGGHVPCETTFPPWPHCSHWHLLPVVVRLPSAFSQQSGLNSRVQIQGDGSVILVMVGGHVPCETTSPPEPQLSHSHALPVVLWLPSPKSQQTGWNSRVHTQGLGGHTSFAKVPSKHVEQRHGVIVNGRPSFGVQQPSSSATSVLQLQPSGIGGGLTGSKGEGSLLA